MTALTLTRDIDDEIQDLARAYRRANGPFMTLTNRLGNRIEGQMAHLPPAVQAQIQGAVQLALTAAHHAAGWANPQFGRRASTLAAIAAGAAGGSAGMAGALAELPVTLALFLQVIQREARLAGFDPLHPGIRAACLEVFANASPLAADDGVNTAFFSARLTLTGPALKGLIARVAPRLTAALGPKLAAQSVPLLGAASGAALNATYLNYYRDMARIRFALMRLAQTHGGESVIAKFTRATGQISR